MGKIEQNKELKRRAILAAAEEVFLDEGYALASMDKIAAIANVTKQTVYRYFPSKTELFKATLQHIAENTDESFLTYLEEADTEKALYKFAIGLMRFHMTEKHLAVYRLLISESKNAPELTSSFFEVGPSQTEAVLSGFLDERLRVQNCEAIARLWTAMLLEARSSILIGMKRPSPKEIEQQAKVATKFLLAAVS